MLTQLPGKQKTDQQDKEAGGSLEWEEQEEEKKGCHKISTGRLSCIKSKESNTKKLPSYHKQKTNTYNNVQKKYCNKWGKCKLSMLVA